MNGPRGGAATGPALLLARVGGALFCAGAVLSLALGLAPTLDLGSSLVHVAVGGVAVTVGAALIARRVPLTRAQQHACGLTATVLVSVCVALTPTAWEAFVPLYAWIGLFYAAVASRRGLLLQLAAVTTGLIVAIVVSGAPDRSILLAVWSLSAACASAVLVFAIRNVFARQLAAERDRLRGLLEAELRHRARQETLYASLAGNIPGVVYRCEVTEGWPTIRIGAEVEELTGYSAQAFEAGEVLYGDLIHLPDREATDEAAQAALASNAAYQTRYRVVHADGSLRWIEDWCRPLELDGRVVLDGVLFDVTEKTEAQLEAARADAEYKRLVESLPMATYVDGLESSAPTSFISPQIASLLGYEPERWVANRDLWVDLLHPDDRARALAENDRHNRTGHPFSLEYRLRNADGAYRWFRDEAVVERDAAGTPIASRGYLIDITPQKQLEQQLLHQAFHDPLTGLANRALLLDRVDHALIRRGASTLAVLYIDIDDLKAVNDSQGHAAGDALLRTVADRIRGCVREGDTAARLGGDEFVVLLEESGANGALRVADAIVDALRAPMMIAGSTIVVSASVGVALAEPHDDCERIVQHADLAMYDAKRHGKGNVRLWSDTLEIRANDRLDLRVALGEALEESQLELFFQPIVALGTGAIAGLEALLRWNHPERGRLLPGQFLLAVDTRDLAVRIGRWAIDEALAALGELDRAAPGQELFVAVNLSAHELDQDGLADVVLNGLGSRGLSATSLVLEITESAIVSDLDGAARRLGPLRSAGVRVAIDDFGTGYSSLNYLGRLPADMLKIPKPFVDALPGDPRTMHVVSRMIDLCSDLGLGIVAEGIELTTQVEALTRMGCELGQGFHFSSPRSLPEIVAALGRREITKRRLPTPE